MIAIFDKHVQHVGWFDPEGKNVFNNNMSWVGFVKENSFFLKNCNWIGGYIKGTFVDKTGKSVAWLNGFQPKGSQPLVTPLRPLRPLTPLKPLRPLNPLRPLIPLTPLGGWSEMEWDDYIVNN